MAKIRMPVVAGSFYPSETRFLEKEIRKFLENAPIQKISGEIKCLIAPHAGYMYSGQTAGYAYKTLEGKNYESVIILAPSHRFGFKGGSIFDGDFYRTPLGDVPIDKEFCQKIVGSSENFLFDDRPDSVEHSLEVQVPFLQVVLKSFKIVPIVVGQFNLEIAKDLADTLAKQVDKKNFLLIASSDLSHYHPAEVAKKMDEIALKTLETGNYKKLLELELSGQVELCGIGPVIVTMIYAEKIGVKNIKVLKYSHSGEITGDNSGVVGYGAVVFSA